MQNVRKRVTRPKATLMPHKCHTHRPLVHIRPSVEVIISQSCWRASLPLRPSSRDFIIIHGTLTSAQGLSHSGNFLDLVEVNNRGLPIVILNDDIHVTQDFFHSETFVQVGQLETLVQ